MKTNENQYPNKFMIVLHGSTADWKKIPAAKQNELLQRYMAWVETLKQGGRFKSGSELHPVYRNLKTVGQSIVVDGPFPETKEVLTGYFIITANDLDDAIEVSKHCPALAHGDWVQVYEMPNRD